MNEINFDTVIVNAGFRLQYLEVLNWGTFNNNIWRIEPKGFNSLLTGDIGSGKSTLVDALTTLLVPSYKITFNKAAGAEGKERNLLTYVRGEYKKEKEEITKTAKKIYLRPDDNTHTVIVANFFNEGYQENVCLAQVFWVKDGKVEKLLIGSSLPLDIKQHLSRFSEITELKKRLRNLQGVSLFDDNFSRYSESFRHRFGMTSDKAIDLFYQTVSMKSVSSLTDFVREQMLEKTDVKEQIAILLKRFDELNKAHAAVVHAREQYNHLKPLVEFAVQYGELSSEIEKIEEMLTAVPAWFAEKKISLIENAIAETTNQLEQANYTLKSIEDELKRLENKKFGLKQDIDNNGGKRLEQIADEISNRSQAKVLKKKEWDNYDLLAKRSGLMSVENETGFSKNLQDGQVIFENCEKKETELREERDKTVIQLREKENELQDEQAELDSLKARKSQIPSWLVEIRNQICYDLQIEEDELPFAGELLKVHDDETEWEGAIERLLHDFGMNLLVSSTHYRSVSRYVNAKTLRSIDGKGRKLNYLEADIYRSDNYTKQLTHDSVLHKIETKPDTAFESWMENYLHRNYAEFACVEQEELMQIPNAITKQGLIKRGKIRHTKDDRWNINDRRNFILGWSNVDKIKALEENVIEIQSAIHSIRNQKSSVEKQQETNTNIKTAVTKIIEQRDYNIIDWQAEVRKIFDLQKEQQELLDKNDQLNRLKISLGEVESELKMLKEKETSQNQHIGGLQKTLENYSNQLNVANTLKGSIDEIRKEKYYTVIEDKIGDKTFKLSNADSFQEQFKKQFEGDTGELKRMRTNLSILGNKITRKMRDIKDHSKAEYSEFSEDVEARPEYIKKFEQLANEDLKRHEDRFKEELNRNVINSISVFDNQLEKHEKDIKQKIIYINQHLHEIVYDSAKGTYITILIDATTNKDIRQFKEDLRLCYINTLGDESGLYNEAKYEQVKKILDRFASMENVDREWTSTVTDVRNWFEFNASERYSSDNTEKEFYEGSGGKSGGQKEKLAYTILASALAYQFGLQFGEDKSRSFRFVVIDEAFGRGSDESTRYGLELFRKLNLQLLIVTPLQKIHIIENHVNAFHFISNRDGNNSQISNLTVQQYKDEKAKRNIIFQPVDKSEINEQ
ncbi:MAG: ATP-dependent exonuclease SbcCD, C subunit-like protein [Chitinophagaceae bacterium]|nr:ATP-dependent exonuclease SbcCD, C subunit-like protein [Chitinophagaceae bacterium]